jgi:hypothetical protein
MNEITTVSRAAAVEWWPALCVLNAVPLLICQAICPGHGVTQKRGTQT